MSEPSNSIPTTRETRHTFDIPADAAIKALKTVLEESGHQVPEGRAEFSIAFSESAGGIVARVIITTEAT